MIKILSSLNRNLLVGESAFGFIFKSFITTFNGRIYYIIRTFTHF
ncbi:MAG: hypothetical protein H6Q14_1726 [Bacteroidetes bacterium]|jgi:hypothetical protein|nr:hypothetical protein [Bacteroidota bacterium]